MRRLVSLLCVTSFLIAPGLAQGRTQTVTDQNSSLAFVTSDTFNLGAPNDPVEIPQRLEWTVDGRRIVVYPSSPSVFLDFSDHFHPDSHVGSNQVHAQGPMLGYATGPSAGGVMGGLVYSVVGGAPGSGISRISEKVDIRNTTTEAIRFSLGGMGWRPAGGAHQQNLEVPDLTGLNVTGNTVVYLQGRTGAVSLIDSPFAPFELRPIVTFAGFNPHRDDIMLQPGATLTMITEIRIGPPETTGSGGGTAGGGAAPDVTGGGTTGTSGGESASGGDSSGNENGGGTDTPTCAHHNKHDQHAHEAKAVSPECVPPTGDAASNPFGG